MTCRDLSESLLDYRCGGLDPAARADLEVHLYQCWRCAEYTRDYDAVVRLAKAVFLTTSELVRIPDSLVKRIIVAAQAQGSD